VTAPDRMYAWSYSDPWGNELQWWAGPGEFTPDGTETEYTRRDPAALAADPMVQAMVAADQKAHEKEIAVWSENYAALERERDRLWTDCGILLAQIDATEDVHGVGPEDEDAVLVAQIRVTLATTGDKHDL